MQNLTNFFIYISSTYTYFSETSTKYLYLKLYRVKINDEKKIKIK